MQFKQDYNHPQDYYWFNNGFSQTELNLIYSNVQTLSSQSALTAGNDVSKEIRSSKVKWIPNNSQWNWLYEKLMTLITMANKSLWNFDIITGDELIQYTEYHASDDGHYTWHQDFGPDYLSHRKVSITVQLSKDSEYEGGDLEIWGGSGPIQTPRGAGSTIIFPSYMLHRVTKVTRGVRKSFVLWVGGSHYR